MHVLAEEVLRPRTQVGEVAPAASGDQDLSPGTLTRFQQQHPPPALASLSGRHQSRSSGAQHNHIRPAPTHPHSHGLILGSPYRAPAPTEVPSLRFGARGGLRTISPRCATLGTP